jgi:hypothetical protein
MKSKTAPTPAKKKSPLRESTSTGTAKAPPSPVSVVSAPPGDPSLTSAPKKSSPKPLIETVVNAAKRILKSKSKTTLAKTEAPAQTVASEKIAAPAKAVASLPTVPLSNVIMAVTPKKVAVVAAPVVPESIAPPGKPVFTKSPEPEAGLLAKRTPAKRKKVEAPAILTEPDAPPAPALAGPGKKFSLGPTVVRPGLDGPEGELPDAYGTKKLFITARDPHWLYAHWDLTLPQQQAYNAESSDGHLVLRVYGAKFEGHPIYEIHVHPESRHWFIHVERAGNSYCAELGYYSPIGKWMRIASSSATITPPDAASSETDVEFATIPFEFPFAKLMHIISEAVSENLPLAQAIEELRRAGHPDLPRLKTTTASPSPALAQRDGAASGAPAPWTPEQAQALAKVICIDQSRRIWMGSLEITELIRRRLTQEARLDISSPLRAFGGPEISGMSGSISRPSLSSPAIPFGAAPKAEKSFWFNVNAELIVYGATEPGAKVTLGGHEIKLRPDGTFSYRFALPDGAYDLPAVAVSTDGTDGRAADLKFSRETQYLGEVGSHPQDPSLKAPLPDSLSAEL